MGWTCTIKDKGEPFLKFFIDHGVFTWSADSPFSYQILDSALVNLKTFYAAVERVDKATGERQVWAAVILIDYHRRGYITEVCWKDLDETMGPVRCRCPEKILKLLTPTDNKNANEWRARCWANIEHRKSCKNLPAGTVLKYNGRLYVKEETPSGFAHRTWVVDADGKRWILSKGQLMEAEIISRPDKKDERHENHSNQR